MNIRLIKYIIATSAAYIALTLGYTSIQEHAHGVYYFLACFALGFFTQHRFISHIK